MRDHERLRLIGDAISNLRTLEPISTGIIAGRAARIRAAQATPNLRASVPAGGGSRGSGHSDPTGSAINTSADRLTRTMEELDQDDADLATAAALIAKVAARSARAQRPPKDPAPVQPRLAGCKSCARDDGYHEMVAAGQYRDLCRPCGDYNGAERRWPPLDAVRWMHRHGKKWTAKVLADALRSEAVKR